MGPSRVVAGLVIALASAMACHHRDASSFGEDQTPRALTGAGATFPAALYDAWIDNYKLIAPTTHVAYQPVGSPAGVRALLDHKVDFAGSDVPLTDTQLKSVAVTHLPMALGAIAVVYNVKDQKLRITPETLVSTFLGEVKTWTDPRIAMLNPKATMPELPLTVVYRAEDSGTAAVFTTYLASISKRWVGSKFPAGRRAATMDAVADAVASTPGAVGFVDLATAHKKGLAAFAIRNRAGRFVEPTIASAYAATSGMAFPDDLRFSLLEATSEEAYPITSFSYLLVYEATTDPDKEKALSRFLRWTAREAQRFGPPLGYATIPPEVAVRVETKLAERESQ